MGNENGVPVAPNLKPRVNGLLLPVERATNPGSNGFAVRQSENPGSLEHSEERCGSASVGDATIGSHEREFHARDFHACFLLPCRNPSGERPATVDARQGNLVPLGRGYLKGDGSLRAPEVCDCFQRRQERCRVGLHLGQRRLLLHPIHTACRSSVCVVQRYV